MVYGFKAFFFFFFLGGVLVKGFNLRNQNRDL